jgi:L-ascorbate metabolism protein UlaG (beta-lactamase superfamily)
MRQPVNHGFRLLAEMDKTSAATPALWWLGHSGFAIKFAGILFYVDPCLADLPGRTRTIASPLEPESVANADMILCTHAHGGHMDRATIVPMLGASKKAKIVLPKSAAAHALSLGIPYDRMTTTDAELRVEYFKKGLYARVYAVPSAHTRLDWAADAGYPWLGYLIRFGDYTVYHAGDTVLYEGLADRLRPYNVTVALLPIGGRNLAPADAARLAEDIGARWLAPMHYGTFSGEAGDVDRFVEHMLGRHPSQRFKVFECGEKWTPG